MIKKFQQSIHFQVIFSLSVLSILWIIVSLSIQSLSSQNASLAKEKAKIDRLSDAVQEIKRNSEIYLLNAARDYESYNRDLAVYYKVTVEKLDSIQQNIERFGTINELLRQVKNSPINFASANELIKMSEIVSQTVSIWEVFSVGLDEKFGDNKDEPRLEWGAEFIVDNIDQVSENLDNLTTYFENTNKQQDSLLRVASNIEIASIISFLVLFGLFFNFKILKPIKKTKAAFQQVSNGDYGHQIEASYKNEIGELVHSFNEMSSRSDTVLSILSELQSANSLDEATNILHRNLTSYTGCDLVSIAVKERQGDGFRFKHLSPAKEFKNLFQLKVSYNNDAEKEHIEKVALNQEPLQISNISEYVKMNRNSVILNNLINRYPLKSAVVLPISVHDRDAFLIFSSYYETKLQNKHLDLILNLMPFVKHKFAALTTNE